jgi:hypothetical protein
MADYDVEGKNEISCAAMLADLAVDASLNQDAGPGVNFIGNHRSDWAERIKPLGPGPLAILFLQVTGSDIVDAGVAQYVRVNVLIRADFMAGPGYNDPEFPFMVHALRDFRPSNLPPGREQGRWRFQEDQGLDWGIMAKLRRMFTIVAAYSDDLGRPYGRQ